MTQPKPISNHVAEILQRMEEIQPLTQEQRVQFTHALYGIMQAKKRGDWIIDPLYPDTDQLTPIVVNYVKGLKPTDVLDDPRGAFLFMQDFA